MAVISSGVWGTNRYQYNRYSFVLLRFLGFLLVRRRVSCIDGTARSYIPVVADDDEMRGADR